MYAGDIVKCLILIPTMIVLTGALTVRRVVGICVQPLWNTYESVFQQSSLPNKND
jgi:hypothetical protein